MNKNIPFLNRLFLPPLLPNEIPLFCSLKPHTGKSVAMTRIISKPGSGITILNSEGAIDTRLIDQYLAQHQAQEQRKDLEAETVSAHLPPDPRRI